MKAYVDNGNQDNELECGDTQFVVFETEQEHQTFRNLLECKYDNESCPTWADGSDIECRGLVVWHDEYPAEDMYNDLVMLGLEIVLVDQSYDQLDVFYAYLKGEGYLLSKTTGDV
jgi:hypothetical protein